MTSLPHIDFAVHAVMLQAGSAGTSGQVHVLPSFALLGCALGTNYGHKLTVEGCMQ